MYFNCECICFVCLYADWKIDFVKAAQTEMGNLKKESANFWTVLDFINLSEEEFDFKDVVLDFKIDGKEIGTIFLEKAKKIKTHSEFNIPIKYSYETKHGLDPTEKPEHLYLLELSGKMTLKDKSGKEIVVPIKHKKATNTKPTKKKEEIIDKERKEEKEKRKEERKKEKNDD